MGSLIKVSISAIYLICFISVIQISIYAQKDIRLSVQTGHSGTINQVDYNSDGSLFASCGTDNKIIVWHVLSGKQYANYSIHTRSVTDVVFHPNENILFAVSLDSTVSIWDVDKNELIDRIQLDYPIHTIDYDHKSNRLAVAGEKLQIINWSNTIEIKTLGVFPRRSFTAIEFSPDGDILVVGGEEELIAQVINLITDEVISKFPAALTDVKFDSENLIFYYTTKNGGLHFKDLVNNQTKGVTTASEWNSFNALVVTTSEIIGVTNEAEIVFFNKDTWKLSKLIKGHLQAIKCIDYNAGNNQVITAGRGKKVILWDLKNGSLIKLFSSGIYQINDIQFSEDGKELIIAFANGFIRKSNLMTNMSVVNRPNISIGQIELGWEYLLTHISKVEENSVEGELMLLHQSMEYEGAYSHLTDMKLVWDIEENYLNLIETSKKSKKIKLYETSLKKGEIKPRTYLLNTENLQDKSESYQAEVIGNNLSVVEKATGKFVEIVTNHTDRITAVALNEKFGFVATASWDGMVKFWDLKTGILLSTYGAFGAHDFVYIDQDNYYFASKGALSDVSFIYNTSIFSFDQFDLKFNRPDIIFGKMPYHTKEDVENYYLAYKKRLDKLGIEEKKLKLSDNIPRLTLKNETGAQSKSGYFSFTMDATDDKEELTSLHLLINGVPVYGKLGKKIEGKSIYLSDSIKLTPGINEIQCYVTNSEGINSFKQSVEVLSSEKKVKSDLYLISIGCSKYLQSAYDLTYADKDAGDIARFFKHSKLFDDVHVQTLINEEVTKSSILALSDVLKNAQENDVVVLFAAGHGILDKNLDYYIATHDMDFMHPELQGIPFRAFEELLDKTRSRKKIMFIDACHSGEIDKNEVIIQENEEVAEDGEIAFRTIGNSVKNLSDVSSFELSRMTFADMRDSNGATVISSSGGGEFSMEGPDWQNGVFTYALLKGLKEEKADLNKDKKIMLSELQAYLIQQVNDLTNGRQTPTSRIENLINDFRIK